MKKREEEKEDFCQVSEKHQLMAFPRCVCTCMCVHLCEHMCARVCMCIHVCTCVYCARTCVYMCMCVCVCAHVCTCVCMCVHVGGAYNFWSCSFSCSVMSDSVTPWTVAHQGPLTTGFSRQEYWSGLPFPSPGDPPDPGIEPASPALAGGFFTTEHQGSPVIYGVGRLIADAPVCVFPLCKL